MYINQENYFKIENELKARNATLVAVSKTKPVEAIKELYDLGHRDFGENYVQEMVEKEAKLPGDIRWHFIGHLQSNKVKYISPFVHLIHSIDSTKLLKEVAKQAQKTSRTINVLLQVHIAKEETKFGLSEPELSNTDLAHELRDMKNVNMKGLMGMASFADDEDLVRNEFKTLKKLFDQYNERMTDNKLEILSMGMSNDYRLALDEGSTMVRIGSLLFGKR